MLAPEGWAAEQRCGGTKRLLTDAAVQELPWEQAGLMHLPELLLAVPGLHCRPRSAAWGQQPDTGVWVPAAGAQLVCECVQQVAEAQKQLAGLLLGCAGQSCGEGRPGPGPGRCLG